MELSSAFTGFIKVISTVTHFLKNFYPYLGRNVGCTYIFIAHLDS